MSNFYEFKIFHPQTRLSPYVQAVWSASLSEQSPAPISRWLQCDTACGLLFNFSGNIFLDDTRHKPGMYWSSAIKKAQSITLPAGASICGIRFLPGMSLNCFNSPTICAIAKPDDNHSSSKLGSLFDQLKATPSFKFNDFYVFSGTGHKFISCRAKI